MRVISTETWQELAELASPTGRIDAVAFSPDGTQLATLSAEEGQLALWNASDASLIWSDWVRPQLSTQTFRTSLAFSADGRRIVTPLSTLTHLDTRTTSDWAGAPSSWEVSDQIRTGPMYLGNAEQHVIYTSKTWEAGAQTFERHVWANLGTGDRTQLAWARTDRPNLHAVSPDGTLLAVADQGYAGPPQLRLHVVGRAAPIVTYPLGNHRLLAFSPDGRSLYMAAGDDIEVLDVQTFSTLRRFPIERGARFIGIAPGGEIVAATADLTSWWNPENGAVMRTLAGSLQTAHWSADGALGVGVREDSLLVAWREPDAAVLVDLPVPVVALPPVPSASGPEAHIVPVPFDPLDSPTGAPVVVRSYGAGHYMATDWRTCHVIDRATRQTIRSFAPLTNARAQLSDDGATLLTVESDAGVIGSWWTYVAVWCR